MFEVFAGVYISHTSYTIHPPVYHMNVYWSVFTANFVKSIAVKSIAVKSIAVKSIAVKSIAVKRIAVKSIAVKRIAVKSIAVVAMAIQSFGATLHTTYLHTHLHSVTRLHSLCVLCRCLASEITLD